MPSSSSSDFVLVGGGIVGACLAEELARGGASVLVLDAGPEPGHATPLAAGVAVPSLRYVRDRDLYGWLTEARSGLEDDVHRLEPVHGAFSRRCPILRLLQDADLAVLPDGLGPEVVGEALTPGELEALEPGLRLPADCRPFLAPDGMVVDGAAYLRAVREAAGTLGVAWRQGTQAVEVADGAVRLASGDEVRAARVVVTAGAWSGQLAGRELVPVFPQRGQLAILEGVEPLPWILSARFYLCPLPGGGIAVGATEEDAGFDSSPTAGAAARLLAFALQRMPALAGARLRALRAGLRPASRTGWPVVGRVPGRDRVYTACGHAGHGLISARHTARGAAAGLLRGEWEALPAACCPQPHPGQV